MFAPERFHEIKITAEFGPLVVTNPKERGQGAVTPDVHVCFSLLLGANPVFFCRNVLYIHAPQKGRTRFFGVDGGGGR